MIANLLSAIIPLFVGIFTWGLATYRIRACIEKRRLLVSSIVFLEEILGMIILYVLISQQSVVGMIFYAVGGFIGSWLANKPNDSKNSS